MVYYFFFRNGLLPLGGQGKCHERVSLKFRSTARLSPLPFNLRVNISEIFRIYIDQFLNSYIYIFCCSFFYHLRFFFVGNRFNFKLMLCRLLARYTYGLNMQHFVSTKMRVYIGSRETRKRVIHWQ